VRTGAVVEKAASAGGARPSARGQSRVKRVTLADVAARAGVSPAAASFVLSGRDDMRIAPETQERVREAAEQLGYRPNLAARSLRTGRSGTIGFVSDLVTSTAYAGEMVRGAMEASRQGGSLLYIAETLGDGDEEDQLLRGMLDRQVDGFILASMFTRRVTIPEALKGHPLVLLNCLADGFGGPYVLPDEEQAGRDAAQLLLETGHHDQIYVVGGRPPRHAPVALRERSKGVAAVLRKAKVKAAGTLVLADWQPEHGRVAVRDLLQSGARPQALICMNDRIALGAYQALSAFGLEVGNDVSIVSFDDSELAGWLEPGLTSIGLPHAEMGTAAVRHLLDPSGAHEVRIPMPVVQRASICSR
jgi:LacI family transcriptional regulator